MRKNASRPDAENPEWTEEDFRRARPALEILPKKAVEAIRRYRGQRGPQKSPTKELIGLKEVGKYREDVVIAHDACQIEVLRLLGKVLEAYTTRVAPGEVGIGGTAVASDAAPTDGRPPTGLLYGRVQSGKTVAMITFCAAAIDNGFRVIVVLTSDFVKLVEQTADRFAALDGPLIKNALQSDNWNDDREHVKKHIGKHGVVFICTKNQQRLTSLVEFLDTIGAAGYPALVLDDEADQGRPLLPLRVLLRASASPPLRPRVVRACQRGTVHR